MTYDALPRSRENARSFSVGEWLRILITDRRILISWLIFVAFSVIYAYLTLSRFQGAESAPPADVVLVRSATAGYLAWSMYWGVPGCIGLLRRLWGRAFAFFGLSTLGCMAIGLFLGFAVVALAYYPPLGGGLFHFVRRWWFAGKRAQYGDETALPQVSRDLQFAGVPGGQEPVRVVPSGEAYQPAAPELLPDVEQRLRALTQLHDRGLISRDEHDRRRGAILDKI